MAAVSPDLMADAEVELVETTGSSGDGQPLDAAAASPKKDADNASNVSSTPPRSTAQQRDLAGVKKPGKGYTRSCKGCQLWFKPEGMGSKSSFCIKDKNKLDNLARLAKAQGKAKWLCDARKDEAKIGKILKKYSELTGDSGLPGGRKQVNKSTLFTTLEKTTATSRVTYDTELKFMPEDAYIKHVTETLLEGEGRLTKAAQLQWKQWSQLIADNNDTDEVMFDRKGANSTLRIAVPVADRVHLSNLFDRAKELTCHSKSEKGLSDLEVSQRKRQLLQNHDSGFDPAEARSMGQAMVRATGSSTAGNAFSSFSTEIDLEDLEKANAEPASEEETETCLEGACLANGDNVRKSETGDKAEKGVPKATAKKKATAASGRKGWFDRDTAIASKVRAETTALCGLQVQLSNKLKEAQAQVELVDKRPPESQSEVSVEKDTLVHRMQFLDAILSEDIASLQSFKEHQAAKELSVASPGDGDCRMEDAAGAGGTDGHQLKQGQVSKAPPCQSYKDLSTISSIKGSLESYWKCQTAVGLRDLARDCTLQRRPITELLGAVNVGVKELKKALTALDQRNAKRSMPNAPTTRKRQKGAVLQQSVFELGLEKGRCFHCVDAASLASQSKSLDLSLPLIVKMNNLDACNQASALKQSMESFEGAFNRHVKGNEKNNLTKAPESRSKVRASAPLCSLDAHAAWDNLCETLLIPDLVPKEVIGCGGKPVVHIGVQCSNTAASEKGWQASLRLTYTGTKTVLACSATSAIAIFGSVDPGQLCQKMLDMTAEDVLRMVALPDGATLWAGTVGPHELFYLPAGWLFAESVLPKCDHMGILCRGIVAKDDACLDHVHEVGKLFSLAKKTDADLDSVLLALTRAAECKAKAMENSGEDQSKAPDVPVTNSPVEVVEEQPAQAAAPTFDLHDLTQEKAEGNGDSRHADGWPLNGSVPGAIQVD